ncbi:ABC transporter substrate-binding protein [Photobacterium sp. TY1-4]|uniref:ABC transporter substrate-binding protein n=1 Tax=Photobacterium sp. TY1-4 TaxID=2899122 RepID=UPI0021C1B72F|nr:ABC transporter substrate-binding protein [Photobacterium sp. TY1-4]UXI02397.1 ABC transporter substrate-binding protein [Photobacterium sp. TY1-4]
MKKFTMLPLAALVASSLAMAEDIKVFKFSEDGTPTTFDPVQSGTTYANTVTTAVYDTLYEYKYLKSPFELKPNLAVDMPQVSEDGLTYTIKLKQGVKFIDDPAFEGGKGREVTAEDFVYSIKRHFDAENRSQGSWLWAGKIVGLDAWKDEGSDYGKTIEGLKALDRHTVQIKLVKPFPQLTYTLAMGYAGVVPVEAVEKYGRELSIHPVGSGPFKLVSHNSTKTVLEKNPDYRQETFDLAGAGYNEKLHGFTGIATLDGKQLPIVDRVELNWVKQASARWNSFSKGSEIVNTTLQNEQMDEVLASKHPVKLKPEYAEKFNFRVNPEAGLVYNFFNFDDEYFGYSDDPKTNAQNKALRCAIVKSFDWPQRISRFYLGIGEAYPGFIVPGTDGFDPNMDDASITQDLAGAKQLLKEHGWNKQNLPVIYYPGTANTRNKQFFEQFRGNLTKIGYPKNKVKQKTFATFGDFNRDVKNSKTQLIPMGWGLDYPDAENTLQLFYGPNRSPGSNSANYNNPEFNKLYEQASVMQPSPERTALYQKMNQMVVDDCVGIGGYSRTRIRMWHKNAIMWPQRDVMGNYLKYVDIKS